MIFLSYALLLVCSRHHQHEHDFHKFMFLFKKQLTGIICKFQVSEKTKDNTKLEKYFMLETHEPRKIPPAVQCALPQ